MNTSFELWGGGSGNDYWAWKHGTNAGGSLATVMTLDKAGLLTVTGNISASGTITGNTFVGDGSGLTSLPTQTANDFTTTLKNKLDAIEASADVTDTTNVTAAGALMDSELTSIANVKALNQSVVSGATPTFTATNFTDASNKRFMSNAQETKLDSVESSADVTDTTNVTAAGALMDSEVASLALIKGLTAAAISGSVVGQLPAVGDGGLTTNDFTNADHTKLNGIETSATADQTNAEIRTAVEAATDI